MNKPELARGFIGAVFEDVDEGEVLDSYPRHITLVPPFTLPQLRLEVVDGQLQGVLPNWVGSSTVRVGREEFFGDEGDVSVRVVSGSMRTLHDFLCGAVRKSSIDNIQYIGDNWQPHITDHEGLVEGDALAVRSVCMFLRGNGVKTLYRRYNLDNAF